MFPAIIIWGLNLYSYHAAKLFEPIFIALLLFIFRRDIIKIPRSYRIKALLLSSVFVIPIIISSIFGSGASRASDLLITKINKENLNEINLIQFNSPLRKISPLLPRLFSNKITYVANQFITNSVSYLSPSFWFTEGGREITYSVLPGTGLLYAFLFPLIVVGVYYLVRSRNKNLAIFCLWLIAGILPATLTNGGYRPNRAGSLLGFWEIVAAFGLATLIVKSRLQSRLHSYLFVFICGLSVVFYLNTYFFEYPYRFPAALSYGYKALVGALSVYPADQTIIIDRGNNSQTFFAFYQRIDPRLFQDSSRVWWADVQKTKPLYLDQLEEYRLGNLVFKNFNPGVDLVKGKVVAIPANKYMDPYDPLVKNIIKYPDGNPAFYILAK